MTLKTKKTGKRLPTVASKCDRYGSSDKAAAAIVSSFLDDISSDFEVVDKSKTTGTERKEARNSVNYKRSFTNLHFALMAEKIKR